MSSRRQKFEPLTEVAKDSYSLKKKIGGTVRNIRVSTIIPESLRDAPIGGSVSDREVKNQSIEPLDHDTRRRR